MSGTQDGSKNVDNKTKKTGPKIPARVALARGEGAAGTDLAANIIVGIFLGWLVEKGLPNIHPWGVVGGLLLGAVSGFVHLFRGEAMRARKAKRRKEKQKSDL